jgi:CrcB protein
MGAAGALARYGIGSWLNRPAFPVGTMLINISGAFLLGLVYSFFKAPAPGAEIWQMALGIGFLGAYTTFSSFMFEADKKLFDGEWFIASVYLAGSVFLGMVAVRLGVNLGQRL